MDESLLTVGEACQVEGGGGCIGLTGGLKGPRFSRSLE